MKQPIATINDPLAPRATGGRPQPPSRDTKKVKVKAHTRHVKIRAPKPPTVPAAPVGDPLAAQVNAAADVKYGPQIRGLNQQVLGSQYNQIRTGNWYSDYEKQLQSQATAQNQAAANVAAALAKTFGNPSAAQTGNAQADALAAQAAQSQSHLGQAFAGTQSQMALDTANRFATGLIPAAGLAGQATQQNEANRQQQLQGQLGDVRGQAGEYKTLLRQQIQAAQQKAQADQEKINLARQALGLKVDTYKNVQVPLAKSLAGNRRSNVRLKGQSQSETKHQHAVDNAVKVNKLALDAYKVAHPKGGKNKGLTPVQRKGSQTDLDRGIAMVRQVYGGKHFNPDKVADQLATSKHAIPRDLALAGAQLVKNEKLGIKGIDDPALARRIRKRYGIKVPVAKQSPVIGGVVHDILTGLGQ